MPSVSILVYSLHVGERIYVSKQFYVQKQTISGTLKNNSSEENHKFTGKHLRWSPFELIYSFYRTPLEDCF